MFWLIWGTVGGLGIFIVYGFTRYGFIYAIIVTALFLPFHVSDYKQMFNENNWIAIIGRSLCLYFIGAYVGGFVAAAGGLMKLSNDRFDLLVLLVCLIFSYTTLGFAIILHTCFRDSRAHKFIEDVFEGMHFMNVLWRY